MALGAAKETPSPLKRTFENLNVREDMTVDADIQPFKKKLLNVKNYFVDFSNEDEHEQGKEEVIPTVDEKQDDKDSLKDSTGEDEEELKSLADDDSLVLQYTHPKTDAKSASKEVTRAKYLFPREIARQEVLSKLLEKYNQALEQAGLPNDIRIIWTSVIIQGWPSEVTKYDSYHWK